MKVQDLISGKENGYVDVDGFKVPVPALKHLMEQGYENVRVYKESRTFSLWGKTSSACFSEEYLSSLAGSK